MQSAIKIPGLEHLLLPGVNLCLLSELASPNTPFKFHFTHIKAWDLEHLKGLTDLWSVASYKPAQISAKNPSHAPYFNKHKAALAVHIPGWLIAVEFRIHFSHIDEL